MDATNSVKAQPSSPSASTAKLQWFWPTLIVGVLSSVLMYPVVPAQMSLHLSDYSIHILFAQNMEATGTIQTPHFLWHLLVISLHKTTNVSPNVSALIVTLLLYFLLGSVIAGGIVSSGVFGITQPKDVAIIVATTLALIFVAPIAFLSPLDRHLYFGYFGINVYHNPTMALLKPIALLSVLLILRASRSKQVAPLDLFVASFVSIAAALSKPNYSLILLPAIFVFAIYTYIKDKNISFIYYSASVIVSTCGIIAWQYLFTYSTGSSSSLVLAPFDVMSHFSNYLALKFLASFAFPLLVTCLYRRQVMHDKGMILAWLLALVGAVLTYLFAETGSRRYDGNFLWSGQIGLFILFVISTVFVLVQIKEDNQGGKKRHIQHGVLGLFLLLHFLSGVWFYYNEYMHPSAYW